MKRQNAGLSTSALTKTVLGIRFRREFGLSRLPQPSARRALALETLNHFIDEYPRYREHGAAYALAVLKANEVPVEIMVIGGDTAWLHAAQMQYHPWRIVRMLDPKEDTAFIAERGYPIDKLPVAFVCKGTTCSAPVYSPDALMTA